MQPSVDLFQGVVPFVATVQCQSVRGAARQLGVTPSAVSKAITKLEEQLRMRLLDRTARRVKLTRDGEGIFLHYRQAVERALAARELALRTLDRPQGELIVSAPVVFARHVLTPSLPRLFERYPDLTLKLSLTDRMVSFSEEPTDAAIRIGDLGSVADAKVLRLAATRWVTVASPVYLARFGQPRSIDELSAHACLRFLAPDGRPRDWTFRDERGASGSRQLKVSGPLTADDGDTLVAAAVGGVGLVQALDFMVGAAVAAGQLMEVLAAAAADGPAVHVIAAPHRIDSPNVRAFVDFVRDQLGPPARRAERARGVTAPEQSTT